MHFLLNKDWQNRLFDWEVKWALSLAGVCVRRVCRPFAIWMTRFSNQRICWPSLLGSPLLCCHILPSLLSSVSFVRRQAAADESSRGVSVPPRLLFTGLVSQQRLSQIYRLTKCCWHAWRYTLNQLTNSLNSPPLKCEFTPAATSRLFPEFKLCSCSPFSDFEFLKQ